MFQNYSVGDYMSSQIKTRTYTMILYPDDDMTHLFALQKLQVGYNFCAIDHDRDVYDDTDDCEPELIGTLKKKHTHVYLRLKSPRFRDPLAKELGIAPNYLRECRDSKGAQLYLIHDGYPNKFQYDVEDVYGPLRHEVGKLLVNEDEGSRVLKVLDLLDSMPVPCTYRKFLVAVCENGMYGDFRRMGSGIKTLLDEHNGAGFILYDV